MKKNGIRFDAYTVEFLGSTVAVAEKELNDGRYLTVIANSYDAADIGEVELVVYLGQESVFEDDDELIDEIDDFEEKRDIIRYDAYQTTRKAGQSFSMFNLNDKDTKALTTLLDEFVKYLDEIEFI